MLQNIVLRRVEGAREEFEIIAGHRRVEAARQKGLRHIEAKILDDVSDLLAEQLGLEENLRRRALKNEPKAMARLVELYEQTSPTLRGGDRKSKTFKRGQSGGIRDRLMSSATRVAKAMGKSPREVRRKARIGRLGTETLQLARTEKVITLVVGERLAGLPASEQDRQVSLLRRRRNQTEPEIRRVLEAFAYVERTLAGRLSGAFGPAAIHELRARAAAVSGLVKELEPASGRKRLRVVVAAKSVRAPNKTSTDKTNVAKAVQFTAASCTAKLSPVGLVPTKTRPRPMAMKPFVASTSVSIQATCPESCVFKGAPAGSSGGCYADAGFSRLKGQRLDAAARDFSTTEIIREEARQIDAAQWAHEHAVRRAKKIASSSNLLFNR